jgi:hypothetical protein
MMMTRDEGEDGVGSVGGGTYEEIVALAVAATVAYDEIGVA